MTAGLRWLGLLRVPVPSHAGHTYHGLRTPCRACSPGWPIYLWADRREAHVSPFSRTGCQGASAAPGAGEASLPQEMAQDFLLTGLLWHRYFPYSHWPSQKTPPWLSPGMASGDSLPVASMMSRKFSEA